MEAMAFLRVGVRISIGISANMKAVWMWHCQVDGWMGWGGIDTMSRDRYREPSEVESAHPTWNPHF